MSFLENLTWRYATKKFDTNKVVSEDTLQKIIDAIRLAPTSYGLQPFKTLLISNEEIRAKLKPVSWNQEQITSCNNLLVFVGTTNIEDTIEEMITTLAGGDSEKRATLAWYESMMRNALEKLDEPARKKWVSEQIHIALGFGLAALAELQVDSCPIGGFDANAYHSILGLREDQFVSVILPIGYRDQSDHPRPKFRLSEEVLFERID